jgi:hypothetical protein
VAGDMIAFFGIRVLLMKRRDRERKRDTAADLMRKVPRKPA